MKSLDKKAEKIFCQLTDGLSKVGESRKIDNSTSFMALHVEVIGRHGIYLSLLQYPTGYSIGLVIIDCSG